MNHFAGAYAHQTTNMTRSHIHTYIHTHTHEIHTSHSQAHEEAELERARKLSEETMAQERERARTEELENARLFKHELVAVCSSRLQVMFEDFETKNDLEFEMYQRKQVRAVIYVSQMSVLRPFRVSRPASVQSYSFIYVSHVSLFEEALRFLAANRYAQVRTIIVCVLLRYVTFEKLVIRNVTCRPACSRSFDIHL
jgi:hypothetical protein